MWHNNLITHLTFSTSGHWYALLLTGRQNATPRNHHPRSDISGHSSLRRISRTQARQSSYYCKGRTWVLHHADIVHYVVWSYAYPSRRNQPQGFRQVMNKDQSFFFSLSLIISIIVQISKRINWIIVLISTALEIRTMLISLANHLSKQQPNSSEQQSIK